MHSADVPFARSTPRQISHSNKSRTALILGNEVTAKLFKRSLHVKPSFPGNHAAASDDLFAGDAELDQQRKLSKGADGYSGPAPLFKTPPAGLHWAALSWAYELTARVSRTSFPGKAYLSGNYAPVNDEMFAENLELVQGQLPEGLDGCYVRAGPNPLLQPAAGYHWFDGDGMLHALRIKDGRAVYCNRYVETDRLQKERELGRPVFVRLGDLVGLRGIALVALNTFAEALGLRQHQGTANTAVVYHAGRVLSLHDGDLPYGVRVLCSGHVETVGRMQLDEGWTTAFTAHPKKDPVNGELLFLGNHFDGNPYVSAGILDEYGNLVRQWGIELPYPVLMHDMAATEHYLILLHLPLCFEPQAMLKEGASACRLRPELPSRIGLIRRDTASCPEGGAEVTWVTLPGPGFMAFHVATSWEDEQGNIKVFACRQDGADMVHVGQLSREEMPHLTEYTLCPASGNSTSRRLTDVIGDFPVVNPDKATRPCKWCWLATLDTTSSIPSFTGIAKLDLNVPEGTDACVARIDYPPGVHGGEATFVPRPCKDTPVLNDEDDGFLCVYLYDSKADASYFNVYDARTMDATPVASVRMPRRVPFGFHGTWINEEQLRSQIMWV